MMKSTSKKTMLGLLPLLLFAVFALCILSVLRTGIDSYRSLTERNDSAYTLRTAGQYVTTKLRQNETCDAVLVEDFAGCSALVLPMELDGERYNTYIYCCGGYLRELFTYAEHDMTPEDGEILLALEAFTAEIKDGILFAEFTDRSGTTRRIIFDLLTRKEAVS